MSFKQGVIEGFFGIEWSWQARRDIVDFIGKLGMSTYIYAPKSDRKLRTQWTEDWDEDTYQELKSLAAYTQEAKVEFGIALSPISLYENISKSEHTDLLNKINAIKELKPNIVCLCFDDMKADIPGLAQIQVELCHTIQGWLPGVELILCPSYYTYDPVLERVFGDRPSDYWQTLSQGLHQDIGIFWTGEEVCSQSYTEEHLIEVKKLLGDRLYLWDNYPVNDGKKLVDFIHIKAPAGRGAHLKNHLRGMMINPMNQAYLSQIPLYAMSQSIEQDDSEFMENQLPQESIDYCLVQQPKAIDFFKKYRVHMQDVGLSDMSVTKKKEILEAADFLPKLMQSEVIDWLNGIYEFDPKCLT